MTETFNAQDDYLLPIGAFAEKLLGDDISPYTKEAAASVQSLLVVFDKYLPVDPTLDEAASKKQKSDFMFGNMHRQYLDLKNDLMDTVPHGVDVASEIENARALVDGGQGVPSTVPAFGTILSKSIGRERVNQSLQAQAALRTIALVEKWEGHEKIVPARVFDNDPKELNVMQSVMNSVLDGGADEVALHKARDVAVIALQSVANKLGNDEQFHAVDNIDKFLNSQSAPQTSFDDTARHYFNLRDNNGGKNAPAPANGPSF